MKRFLIIVLSILALLAAASEARAQRFSVSTNFGDWLDLGTINAEAGMAVGRHWTLHAGFRYNNWTFRKGLPEARLDDVTGETERQFQDRKQSYAFRARWWPWYIYSGFSMYAKAQYMQYNRGGILRHDAEEGDAFGIGLGASYTYMLTPGLDIEFGLGVWNGATIYNKYRCTNCGELTESGTKYFILPDELLISLIYVF